MASSFSEVGTTTEGFKKKKSQELHLGPAQFEKSVVSQVDTQGSSQMDSSAFQRQKYPGET